MTQVGRVRETELDGVFHALANATRRRILDVVAASPGCGVNQVAGHFDMSRIGVLKHVNLLEEAGLLVSERVGRERPLYVNLTPLQMIQERWSDQYRSFWAGRLTRLKYAVEGEEGK
jgi:DNA-binding transcriptional ArsR family regulator